MANYDNDDFDEFGNQGQQETGNGLRSALEAAKREAAEQRKAAEAVQAELAKLRKELAVEKHHLNDKQVALMEKTGLNPEEFVKEYGDLFGATEASEAAAPAETQAPNAAQQISQNEAANTAIAEGFNRIIASQDAGSSAIQAAADPATAALAKIVAEGGDANAVATYLASLPGQG
jgi:hypothetical protein